VRDDIFVRSDLPTASPLFQALTWLFQIMPLHFFAGVAASVQSWTPGTGSSVSRPSSSRTCRRRRCFSPGTLFCCARCQLRTLRRSPGGRFGLRRTVGAAARHGVARHRMMLLALAAARALANGRAD
jgi:hypothetical protein